MVAPNADTFIGLQFARFTADLSLGRAAISLTDLEERIDYAMLLCQWAIDRIGHLPLKEESVRAGERLQDLLGQWLEAAKQISNDIDVVKGGNQFPQNEAAFRDAVLNARISVSMSIKESYDQAIRIEKYGHAGCVTTEELRRELRGRLGA